MKNVFPSELTVSVAKRSSSRSAALCLFAWLAAWVLALSQAGFAAGPSITAAADFDYEQLEDVVVRDILGNTHVLQQYVLTGYRLTQYTPGGTYKKDARRTRYFVGLVGDIVATDGLALIQDFIAWANDSNYVVWLEDFTNQAKAEIAHTLGYEDLPSYIFDPSTYDPRDFAGRFGPIPAVGYYDPKCRVRIASPRSGEKFKRLDLPEAEQVTGKASGPVDHVRYRFRNSDDDTRAFPQEWQTAEGTEDWIIQLPVLPLGQTVIEVQAIDQDGVPSPAATVTVIYEMPPLEPGSGPATKPNPRLDTSRTPAAKLGRTGLSLSTLDLEIEQARLLGGTFDAERVKESKVVWVASVLHPAGPSSYTDIFGTRYWRAPASLGGAALAALAGAKTALGDVFISELRLREPAPEQEYGFKMYYDFTIRVEERWGAGGAITLFAHNLQLVVKFSRTLGDRYYLPSNDSLTLDGVSPARLPDIDSYEMAWIVDEPLSAGLDGWHVAVDSGTLADAGLEARFRAAFTDVLLFRDSATETPFGDNRAAIGDANFRNIAWRGDREPLYMDGLDLFRMKQQRREDLKWIRKQSAKLSLQFWSVANPSSFHSLAATRAPIDGPVPTGADTKPPTIRLTSPKSGAKFDSGAAVALIGEASDNVGVSSIEYRFDTSSGWSAEAVTEGRKVPFDIQAPGAPDGLRVIYARAVDSAGNRSATASVKVTVGRTAQLSLSVDGDGQLSAPGAGDFELPLRKKLTVTATPSPGWRFAGWISDDPAAVIQANKITLPMGMPAVSAIASFTPNPTRPLTGTYRAILLGLEQPRMLEVTITAPGAYSAVLREGGVRTIRWSGILDSNSGFNAEIPEGDWLLPIGVSFDGQAEDPTLTGFVSYADAEGNSLGTQLQRSSQGRRRKFTSLAGLFQGPWLGAPSAPFAGPGWARWTIASAGTVTFSARLPDGTLLSGAGWVHEHNDFDQGAPIYLDYAKGLGAVAADATYSSADDSLQIGNEWVRPQLKSGPNPDFDFTAGSVAFNRYTPPQPGEALFDLGFDELPQLTIPREHVESGDLTMTFRLDAANRVQLRPGMSAIYSLSIDAKKGTYKGTFLDAFGSRTRAFDGVLDRVSRNGFGLYLFPEGTGAANIEITEP